MRISISKLLIDLDQLAATYIKYGSSLSLQPQNKDDADDNSNNNDDDDILEYKYDLYDIDVIDGTIELLILIDEGVKAHKEEDYEKAWKCFERQAENSNRKGKHWKAYYL